MRLVFTFWMVGLLSACAAPASQSGPGTASPERCEAATGSRLARCDRGDARVISRDEIERSSVTGGPVAEPK